VSVTRYSRSVGGLHGWSVASAGVVLQWIVDIFDVDTQQFVSSERTDCRRGGWATTSHCPVRPPTAFSISCDAQNKRRACSNRQLQPCCQSVPVEPTKLTDVIDLSLLHGVSSSSNGSGRSGSSWCLARLYKLCSLYALTVCRRAWQCSSALMRLQMNRHLVCPPGR